MIRTIVNEEMLRLYCERYPEAEGFLEVFFGDCAQYAYDANKAKYERELKFKASINRAIGRNANDLIDAFAAITYRPSENYSHFLLKDGRIVGEATDVAMIEEGSYSALVRVFGKEESVEYKTVEKNMLREKCFETLESAT